MNIADCVEDLIAGPGAVLRVVRLVADRRVPGDRNQAEAGVPRVRGDLRQSHFGIEIAAKVLVEGADRNPVEAQPELVQEIGREDMGLARRGVVRRAARTLVPKPGTAANVGPEKGSYRLRSAKL